MTWRSQLAVFALVLGVGIVALGQSSGACDPAKATPSTPCPAARSPSTAEQFPYPGDSVPSGRTASPTGKNPAKDQFPYPGEPEAPSAGDAKPAKDRFLYPGEPDASAQKDGSGESSSSSAGELPPPSADGKPDLKDEGTEGSTARGRRRLRPQAQKVLSDDERVEEDLSVAHFYSQSGNLNGAYLRTKDAVKIEPQAASVHLALAEVAQKMGKRDEAVAEYTKYLELEPDGDGAKTAKKGLEKLKP